MAALATEGMHYCYAVALSLVKEWVKVDENEMMTGRSAEIAINVRWPPTSNCGRSCVAQTITPF